MYLEEKLERLERTLEKRLDTLERLTEERLSGLEEDAEATRQLITACNSGTLTSLLELLSKIEEQKERVDRLETPTLFPAEAAKQ